MSNPKISIGIQQRNKKESKITDGKKYSLDSDEEDDVDEGNILDDNDIEGEEEGTSANIGEERFTAFNMQEEMEEGHFDRDGHFIWKNEKEVRDNWLDNIDWEKIKPDVKLADDKGLGEESDDSDLEPFQEVQVYKQIIAYMEPKETINKALIRLGRKNKNLSSLERIKLRKKGMLNSNTEVIKLTELADMILSETGNMDIYEETYEAISLKIGNSERKNLKRSYKEAELDMYSDDFDTKEKAKLETVDHKDKTEEPSSNTEIMWEFKWDLKSDKTEGPFDTHQMLKWVNEDYFKKGALVRKYGEEAPFYSTNRVDFELYL